MKIGLKKIANIHEYAKIGENDTDFSVFFNIETKYEKDNNECHIDLQIQFFRKTQEIPGVVVEDMVIDLKTRGVFQLIQENDDGLDMEKVMRVNCCAILYPFVRERIARITSDSLYGKPYYLPAKNFVKMYKAWLEPQKS